MENKIIIVGAGAFSVVVAEAALIAGYEVIGFADDHKPMGSEIYRGLRVIGTVSTIINTKSTDFTGFVIAIGNNEIRKSLFETLQQTYRAVNIIHPNAIVSDSVSLGGGNMVLAGAVVNASSHLGDNNIINSMVLIDHDSTIGNHCYIAQGAIIGSNVEIGDSYKTELGDRLKSFSKIK